MEVSLQPMADPGNPLERGINPIFFPEKSYETEKKFGS